MYTLAQKHHHHVEGQEDVQGQALAIAESLRFLASIASYHCDDALAHTLYEESLALTRELDYKEHIGSCLERLASIAAEQGQPVWASRLYRLAVSLRDSAVSSRSPVGDRRISTTATGGEALLTGATPNPGAKHSLPYPDGLSAREVEVLRLVAQGLTDAQVADRLVISPRTVNYHLTSIYKKLQVSSRCAATRYAIEHRLI